MAEVPSEIAALVTTVTGVRPGNGGGKDKRKRSGTDREQLHLIVIETEPFRFANKKVQLRDGIARRQRTAGPEEDGGRR